MASSIENETTHKTYDVLVTSFKKDGRIVYTHLPKKQEETPFWSHISIKYMTHDNDLVVVYNDNKKNVTGEFSQQSIDSLGNSVFVMATINEAGSVQRQVSLCIARAFFYPFNSASISAINCLISFTNLIFCSFISSSMAPCHMIWNLIAGSFTNPDICESPWGPMGVFVPI
jgi:hypothetical protein